MVVLCCCVVALLGSCVDVLMRRVATRGIVELQCCCDVVLVCWCVVGFLRGCVVEVLLFVIRHWLSMKRRGHTQPHLLLHPVTHVTRTRTDTNMGAALVPWSQPLSSSCSGSSLLRLMLAVSAQVCLTHASTALPAAQHETLSVLLTAPRGWAWRHCQSCEGNCPIPAREGVRNLRHLPEGLGIELGVATSLRGGGRDATWRGVAPLRATVLPPQP